MAAALAAMVNVRQNLRNNPEVSGEDAEVGNFFYILGFLEPEGETEEEKKKIIEDFQKRRADFFKGPMQNLLANINLKEGDRKKEVQGQHREGVIRYMTLLANEAKIPQINRELRKTIKNEEDLRRIEQNIRNSGALIYQFPSEILVDIIKIIEQENGNLEKVNKKISTNNKLKDSGVTPEGYALLIEPLVKFWLPKKV